MPHPPAHEGTHVEDFLTQAVNDYIAHGSLPALSDFSREYRGYQTSAWAASALGVPNLSFGGYMIWNESWRAVDRQTLMDKGITNVVTHLDANHPETVPHNPWPN